MPDWDEMDLRKRDALVAEEVMEYEVVADDWPCGREPECGRYEATHCLPPVGSWYDEEDYVMLDPVKVRRAGDPIEWGPNEGEPYPEPRWPPEEAEEAIGDKKYADVVPVPNFTTEISAAWKVIEKVRETDHMIGPFSHHLMDIHDIDGRYTKKGTLMQVLSEVRPETICLAALRAKGVNV